MNLLDLLGRTDRDRTAVILPELPLRISYGSLRDQVEAAASALVGASVRRSDRVGVALPNGLPMIVGVLAATVAATAAPLNPGYREDEFRFYLEDAGVSTLLLPPAGLEEARRAMRAAASCSTPATVRGGCPDPPPTTSR